MRNTIAAILFMSSVVPAFADEPCDISFATAQKTAPAAGVILQQLTPDQQRVAEENANNFPPKSDNHSDAIWIGYHDGPRWLLVVVGACVRMAPTSADELSHMLTPGYVTPDGVTHDDIKLVPVPVPDTPL